MGYFFFTWTGFYVLTSLFSLRAALKARREGKPLKIGSQATPDDKAKFLPWKIGVVRGLGPLLCAVVTIVWACIHTYGAGSTFVVASPEGWKDLLAASSAEVAELGMEKSVAYYKGTSPFAVSGKKDANGPTFCASYLVDSENLSLARMKRWAQKNIDEVTKKGVTVHLEEVNYDDNDRTGVSSFTTRIDFDGHATRTRFSFLPGPRSMVRYEYVADTRDFDASLADCEVAIKQTRTSVQKGPVSMTDGVYWPMWLGVIVLFVIDYGFAKKRPAAPPSIG